MVRQSRRALLGAGVSLVVGGLAGCLRLNDPTPTGTPTDTATATDTPTPTNDPSDASFEEQLAALRRMSGTYAGADGLESALEDGYQPTAPYFSNPQHVWIIDGDQNTPRADLSLEAFNSLLYIRSDTTHPFQLGAVGYGVSIEDHGAADHTPPDLFNDEGADLVLTEREGWEQFNPDQHPDPGDHEGFTCVFSDHDDTVRESITDLSREELWDVENWAFVQRDEWESRGGISPGDTYDVDGDGQAEVLDFTFERRGAWGLTVWVHTDNPGGLFRGRYVPDTSTPTETPTPGQDISAAPFERQLEYVREISAKYAGEGGIENALADFAPAGIHHRNPEYWFFVKDQTGVPRDELTIDNFDSIFYIRKDSGPLRFGGVGYGVSIEDHGAADHTPPDLFNDEGEDLVVSEREGWEEFTPDQHPDPGDHRGFNAVFSNYDDTVLEERPPPDRLLDPDKWGFIPPDEWEAAGGYALGDTYDVDGDGTEDVIDWFYHRRVSWGLAVWAHIDNPNGVFAGWPPDTG